MSRFTAGAVLTFLTVLTTVGWVAIAPIGALSLVAHGMERESDTATEGMLWASRVTFLCTVVFAAFVAFVLMAIFTPRLAMAWAATLIIVAFVLFNMPRKPSEVAV